MGHPAENAVEILEFLAVLRLNSKELFCCEKAKV